MTHAYRRTHRHAGAHKHLRRLAAGGRCTGRTITLSLKPDGSAEFTTTFLGKSTIVEKGTWKDNGDGTLTVTLTEKDGQKNSKPVVMKFQKDGASLKLVDYDKNVWGSEGLTLNQASEVAKKLSTSLFTLDLQAGFPLDPTILSVNGGGEIDAESPGQRMQRLRQPEPVGHRELVGQGRLRPDLLLQQRRPDPDDPHTRWEAAVQ